MMYEIVLKDHNRMAIDFTPEQAQAFKDSISKRSTRFVEIGDQLISPNDIARFSVMPEEKKSSLLAIPEHEDTKEEKMVAMKGLFAAHQKNGLFKNYQSYEHWQHEKYCLQSRKIEGCNFCKENL